MSAAQAVHTDDALESVAIWAGYYRANPHRFVKDFFNINLKPFQKLLLFMMNLSNFFVYIAARGQGKSFLIAIFCCLRCILYPGTRICVASGTRGQSVNILEKIKTDILPNSPALKLEIMGNIIINTAVAYMEFKNGSMIKVTTASDSARGNRANILIIDEARMVKKDTIDTVLKKFLTSHRMPGYLADEKYQHLIERNKQIYLTSAYYKNHWFYHYMVDCVKNMLDPARQFFACGLPYQLSLKEGLLSREAVEDEMLESDFNQIKWSMEMETLWFGDADGTFFDFESISKNRKIEKVMLPQSLSMLLDGEKDFAIPIKQPGEKRLLSVDLALMQSTKHMNDASSLFVNQLIPTRGGKYISNIMYSETAEGKHTEDQALRIRKLYEEYDADYIVIDAKGAGIGVCDTLVRDITDPETGEIYPALSSCNDEVWAARCSNPQADKVLWMINASAKFNSDCAILLREGFRTGKIRLPVTEYEAESLLNNYKSYRKLEIEDRVRLQMPYIDTTLLVNELINLRHEESSGLIKISEKKGARKDRYSSLSYNYWVATQLEKSLRVENYLGQNNMDFFFRAPKTK